MGGLPAEVFQVDFAIGIKHNAFGFQQVTLVQFTTGKRTPKADLALGIDDTLPRYVGKCWQGVQRIPYQTGMTR